MERRLRASSAAERGVFLRNASSSAPCVARRRFRSIARTGGLQAATTDSAWPPCQLGRAKRLATRAHEKVGHHCYDEGHEADVQIACLARERHRDQDRKHAP